MGVDAYKYGKMMEAAYSPYLDEYYEKEFNRFEYINNPKIQRKHDVDRRVWINNKEEWSEDKYVLDKPEGYKCIFVETNQNSTIPGGSKGWVYVSKAHHLIYCWCSPVRLEIRINHIAFRPFKEWFLDNINRFYFHQDTYFNTRPQGYLVDTTLIPKDMIKQDSIFYKRVGKYTDYLL